MDIKKRWRRVVEGISMTTAEIDHCLRNTAAKPANYGPTWRDVLVVIVPPQIRLPPLRPLSSQPPTLFAVPLLS